MTQPDQAQHIQSMSTALNGNPEGGGETFTEAGCPANTGLGSSAISKGDTINNSSHGGSSQVIVTVVSLVLVTASVLVVTAAPSQAARASTRATPTRRIDSDKPSL